MSHPLTLPASPGEPRPRSWAERYGDRHRWVRVADLPPGLTPPRKVRVYRRAAHFLLNWWDPAAGKSLSERVDGDLLAALSRARDLDRRLTTRRSAGVGAARHVGHAELVARYLDDLGRRADAGEVAPATAARYRAALAHYLAYCEQPAVVRFTLTAARAGRPFRLGLAAFLADRSVGGNGRPGAVGRPMRGAGFVLAVVRGVYAWAADPARGGLLPDGPANPFDGAAGPRTAFRGDPLAAPAISVPMAAALLTACDDHELRVFVPLVLFGLRAAEPCLLFGEHLTADELRVPCLPGLGYQTKGRRDKRFPLPAALAPFWDALRDSSPRGLLLVARRPGGPPPPLAEASLAELEAEYRSRLQRPDAPPGAYGRRAVRDRLLRDAGGLTYDDIERAGGRVRRRLGWPAAATLKDFRHLFATTLAEAGVPDGYRRYWMGHAPGREALVAYTHLAGMREQFDRVVAQRWGPVVAALTARLR